MIEGMRPLRAGSADLTHICLWPVSMMTAMVDRHRLLGASMTQAGASPLDGWQEAAAL